MAEKGKKSQVVALPEASVSGLQTFDFHDLLISTAQDERTGDVYCVPKEISDHLGLHWSGQLAKFKGDMYRNSLRYVAISSPRGTQSTTLLNVEMLPAWLMSIQSSRVHARYRERLIAFQRECAKALDDYWRSGVAVNPRAQQGASALDRYPEMRAIVQSLEVAAQARILAEQATAQASRAEAKADLAIEDGKRMTIEEFVLKNGLLRQLPVSEWRSMAVWLTHFCHAHNLAIQKQPVPGKLWPDENSYPLAAFGAWRQAYQQRWHQIPLVEEDALVYETASVDYL